MGHGHTPTSSELEGAPAKRLLVALFYRRRPAARQCRRIEPSWCSQRNSNLARAVLGGDRSGGEGGTKDTMNPSREEALFALALQKSAGERTAFLARECAVDVGLRGGVERLHGTHLSLQRHQIQSGDVLEMLPVKGGQPASA